MGFTFPPIIFTQTAALQLRQRADKTDIILGKKLSRTDRNCIFVTFCFPLQSF